MSVTKIPKLAQVLRVAQVGFNELFSVLFFKKLIDVVLRGAQLHYEPRGGSSSYNKEMVEEEEEEEEEEEDLSENGGTEVESNDGSRAFNVDYFNGDQTEAAKFWFSAPVQKRILPPRIPPLGYERKNEFDRKIIACMRLLNGKKNKKPKRETGMLKMISCQ
jgi:hypothetical protein